MTMRVQPSHVALSDRSDAPSHIGFVLSCLGICQHVSHSTNYSCIQAHQGHSRACHVVAYKPFYINPKHPAASAAFVRWLSHIFRSCLRSMLDSVSLGWICLFLLNLISKILKPGVSLLKSLSSLVLNLDLEERQHAAQMQWWSEQYSIVL